MTLQRGSELLASPVVANCRMNRERELSGGNSYTRDLGFCPVAFLRSQLEQREGQVRWLDLCCGRGRALIAAAARLGDCRERIEITGVDLVGPFDQSDEPNLRFVDSPLERWRPEVSYDLVTCVHGLHYVGDKIRAVSRAVSWLTQGGTFVAHLDARNLKHAAYRDFGRVALRHLRTVGLEFDSRTRRLRCTRRLDVTVPWQYLGGDDQAGPNFTGQSAVDSWYGD